MAYQSRGNPAEGSFLSAQASTSPQQHNVADCALARTDMLPLAKLVTWSYLTLGRQGHAILLCASEGEEPEICDD